MKDIKKGKKKLKSKMDKIVSNCEKKKYSIIPANELKEAIILAEEINDKEEFMFLYTSYKKYIPSELIERIEKIIGKEKKKEVVKTIPKQEELVEQNSSNIDIQYITEDDNFKSKTYDELDDKTKELLKCYKKEGFLFNVVKAHRSYELNYEEDQIMDSLEKKYHSLPSVYWANDTEIKIALGSNVEITTVLDAVEKYKNNVPIIMKLNRLLGLSIYTPADAYFEIELYKQKVKVLK